MSCRKRDSTRHEDKLTRRFDERSLTVKHSISLRISPTVKARAQVPLVDGLCQSHLGSTGCLLNESHHRSYGGGESDMIGAIGWVLAELEGGCKDTAGEGEVNVNKAFDTGSLQ